MNGLSLVNGEPLPNSDSDKIFNAFNNILVILNENDALSETPIDIKPINVITGLDAGTQYIIPGGFIDSNFEISYLPTAIEILPAELTVTTGDTSLTYGDVIPEFTGSINGLRLGDTAAEIFPEGLIYSVGCSTCNVVDSPYSITATSETNNGNYTISYENTGLLTVNPFNITISANDATITYGQQESLGFTINVSPDILPYEETTEDILGNFTYTPENGCTDATVIEIIPSINNPNYNINLENGSLTISATSLQVAIGTLIINEGDPIPTNFTTTVTGLVCDDQAPILTDFIIMDQNGTTVNGILAPGEYTVSTDLAILEGYDNYNLSLQTGTLFVSPMVGCNDRIKASDICQSPATLSDYPQITTKLRFEYTNPLSVPVFIENGPNNILKGNAFYMGTLPEVFLPGVHSFDIYTDGRRLQWEVITNGCNSASKSANGSNANPCGTSFSFDMSSIEQTQTETSATSTVYPNPVSNYVTLNLKESIQPTELSVFNETGQLLLFREISPAEGQLIEIDLTSFDKGMLFFRVENEGEPTYIKVLKN